MLSATFGDYKFTAWKFTKVVTQMQLLLFSALTFFVWIKWLKRTDTIVLDTDWFYRRGGRALYRGFDKTLNGANEAVHAAFVGRFIAWVSRVSKAAPSRLVVIALTPLWMARGLRGEELDKKQMEFYEDARLGAFPIGATAVFAVVLLGLLFFF
jgi:multicomponent Na+:H+ antiporter subunit D